MLIQKNFEQVLKKLKIFKNDTIMLHGDAGIIAQFSSNKNAINIFFNFLIKYIRKGTILVPSFTTSFCKKKFFDSKNSKSETGLMSEIFRNRRDTKRTIHPIFSFCIYGEKWKYFNKASNRTCFGKKSIFNLFHKINGKILILGTNFEDVVTFVHYIEESIGVNYRYLKKFSGLIVDGNKKKKITTSYYVRNLTMDKSLITPVALKKILISTTVGRYNAYSIESKKLFSHCLKKLKKNKYYLVN